MLTEMAINIPEGTEIYFADEQDAEELLEIYAPYVLNTAITFEYDVPAPEEFRKRIRMITARYPYLTARRDGELIAYAYAGPFKSRAAYDWAVETSIYVKMGRAGQGLGRLLYELLESALAAQGIVNMNACITFPKADDKYLDGGSVAFHSRMGFEHVGRFHDCGYKFGRWYDMVWMEKHIGPHLREQPGVIPFPELREAVGKRLGIKNK